MQQNRNPKRRGCKILEIEGNPIGQSIECNWPKSTRNIVGVIDDVYFESLYNKIKPAVFLIRLLRGLPYDRQGKAF